VTEHLGLTFPPAKIVYLVVFGVAAVACFHQLRRTARIPDDDTRWGMFWLLVASGLWASSQVAYLLLPTAQLKVGAYIVGLVVGFATIGPWLYFCSAYTGRSLHRVPGIRRAAVALFLFVTAIKVTNPLHHLYFRTQVEAEPFVHLAVSHGTLHWIAMGLAYALATVGYFMLTELFWRVGRDARPLFVLVGLTALPVGLDVLGLATPLLIDIAYEPLGVAIFAVGTLTLFLDRFQTVRIAAEGDDAVIILDEDSRVRDFNKEAKSLFPGIDPGAKLDEVAPALAADRGPGNVLRLSRPGGPRFYEVAANPFTTDHARLGKILTLTDVTERRQNRKELERQNERLENFASVVSHDLRNPLNVARGHLELAREEGSDEHLDAIASAHDRMETLIEDILTLARQGQPIDAYETVDLATVARRSWDSVEHDAATLSVEESIEFNADPDRLQQLLENLMRNAITHGGATVEIRIGQLSDRAGFFVADDGVGIPEADREEVFDSGFTTEPDGTGFGLAIVAEIVEAHGWQIEVTESDVGGARFEIVGVERGR
jgi:two-component sensor histidine kinase